MTNSVAYKPTGRLDVGTAAAHEKSIKELLVGEVNSIDIDLSEVDFLSSAGLRVLLAAAKIAQTKGGKVVLISPKPAVLDVLEVTGFDKLLQIR